MNHTNIKVGHNGRLVIPADMRQELELKDGDELLVTLEPGRLILETEEALLERLYQVVGDAPEGVLVSEELLVERREAARQEQDALGQ